MNRKVTIIGAGFSGLASAYYLVRAGYTVEIFEASDRVGGLISTRHVQHGLVESAANGFLNSKLVEDLFRDLGVDLIATLPSARKRFIFRSGKPRRWPIGFVATLKLAWFGVRYIVARDSVAPKAGESVSAWGQRTLGLEASQYLVDAALQGIYAGDPARMSARLIFGRMFTATRREKPTVKGSVSANKGMQEVIDALANRLREKGVVIHLNSLGKPAITNPTLIATSAKDAAALDSRRELRAVELRPVTTTTAFFQGTDPDSVGFGILFPPVERRKFLGVLKNNFVFPNRGVNSETWIKAGLTEPIDEIVSERKELFGLNEQPLEAVVTKWPGAIPHYTLELEKAIPELEKGVNNVFLMGNYLGDLGLARILERASKWPERLSSEGQWT